MNCVGARPCLAPVDRDPSKIYRCMLQSTGHKGNGGDTVSLDSGSELDAQADAATLPLGSVLAERYRITGLIGKGGMGVVYRGEHVHTERQVAIKMLLSGVTSDSHAFRRFYQEAKSASLLVHPNIVSIMDFDVDKTSNQAYLVMDYLDGDSIENIVDASGPMSPERFFRVFMQACRAMGFAHKHGIIHRDIKPSNLMLINRAEEEDVLVVVDFGLVKMLSMSGDSAANQKLTTTNMLVGSPLYMSPEQCRGLSVIDHRSDIYSLGCVMYKCLTGMLPLIGDSALDTLYKHVSATPAPFAETNPQVSVPPALERVVMKALSKDMEQRQQSMSQLAQEIAESLNLAPRSNSTDSTTDALKSLSSKAAPTNATACGGTSLSGTNLSDCSESGFSYDAPTVIQKSPGEGPFATSHAPSLTQPSSGPANDAPTVIHRALTEVPASNASADSFSQVASQGLSAAAPAQRFNVSRSYSGPAVEEAGLHADHSGNRHRQLLTMILSVLLIAGLGIAAICALLVSRTENHTSMKPSTEAAQSTIVAASSPSPAKGGMTAVPVNRISSLASSGGGHAAVKPLKKVKPHIDKSAQVKEMAEQADMLRNEADLQYEADNWSNSLDKYKAYLRLEEKILGKRNDSAHLLILCRIAVCADKSGNVEDAVTYMNRIGDEFYRNCDEIKNDANLMWQLAAICRSQHNLQLCEDLQEKSIDAARASHESLPNLVDRILQLAETYAIEGKNEESLETFRTAMQESQSNPTLRQQVVVNYHQFLVQTGRVLLAKFIEKRFRFLVQYEGASPPANISRRAWPKRRN